MYESIAGNNSIITNFPGYSLSVFNQFSDVLTGGLLLANWLYPFYHLQALPNSIALAFTWNGNPLLSGRKLLLFALPVIGTICYRKAYKKIQSVENINYPFRVTERNYTSVYEWARSCLRFSALLTQLAIFGQNLLVINGREAATAERVKWVRKGLLAFVVGAVVGVGSLYYVLKSYVMDEKETATSTS